MIPRTLGTATTLVAALLAGSTPATATSITAISGRLLDLDRRPLAGIEVSSPGDGTDGPVTTTGADGVFRLSVPSAQGRRFVVRDPQARYVLCSPEQQTDVDPGEREELWIDVDHPATSDDHLMCRPVSVTGRVVDASGKALRSASVVFGRTGETTDDDGRFVVKDLMPRRLLTLILAADRDDTWGSTVLTVNRRLPDGGTVDLGTLRAAARDQELGAVDLPTFWQRGLQFWALRPRQPVLGDHEGRPSNLDGWAKMLPGQYIAQISDNAWYGGASPRSATPITVRAGAVTRIAGTETTWTQTGFSVRDADGRGVNRLFAIVRRVDDPVEVITTAFTDVDNMTFHGLPRGRYRVTLVDPLSRYATSTSTDSEVRLGRAKRSVPDYDRSPPRRSGELLPSITTGKERSAILPAGVVVVHEAAGGRVVDAAAPNTPISNLPEGSYKLRFVDPTGRLQAAWIGGGTSLASARSFRVDLGSRVDLPPLVVRPAFSPIVLPRLKGAVRTGRSIAVTRGIWDGAPTRFDYRWFRDGKLIRGAERNRYKVRSADVGHRITARVVARRSGIAKAMRTKATVAAR